MSGFAIRHESSLAAKFKNLARQQSTSTSHTNSGTTARDCHASLHASRCKPTCIDVKRIRQLEKACDARAVDAVLPQRDAGLRRLNHGRETLLGESNPFAGGFHPLSHGTIGVEIGGIPSHSQEARKSTSCDQLPPYDCFRVPLRIAAGESAGRRRAAAVSHRAMIRELKRAASSAVNLSVSIRSATLISRCRSKKMIARNSSSAGHAARASISIHRSSIQTVRADLASVAAP
jgi:hypothetical protein